MSSDNEHQLNPLGRRNVSKSSSASDGNSPGGDDDQSNLSHLSNVSSNLTGAGESVPSFGRIGDGPRQITKDEDLRDVSPDTQGFSSYNIWDSSTGSNEEETDVFEEPSEQQSTFFLPSEFGGLSIKDDEERIAQSARSQVSSLAQAAGIQTSPLPSSASSRAISSAPVVPLSAPSMQQGRMSISSSNPNSQPARPSSLSAALHQPKRPIIGLDAPPPGFLSPINISESSRPSNRQRPDFRPKMEYGHSHFQHAAPAPAPSPYRRERGRGSDRWSSNYSERSGQSEMSSPRSRSTATSTGYDWSRHDDVSFRSRARSEVSEASSQSSLARYSHGGLSSRTSDSRGGQSRSGQSYGSGSQYQRRYDRRAGGGRTQSSSAIQNMLSTAASKESQQSQPKRGMSALPSLTASSFSDNIDEQQPTSKKTGVASSLSFSLPPHSALPSGPVTDKMDRHYLESALGEETETTSRASRSTVSTTNRSKGKNKDWRLKMNRLLSETPIGDLDPVQIPISVMMNEWAKTKSSDGATMVETLLNRAEAEVEAGNEKVELTTKMYTIAVDAWAKSREGSNAAKRAEAILQHMFEMYKTGQHEKLKPATGIFNAVVNSWAQSRDEMAPARCEQILNWMDELFRNGNNDVKPDTYTYNTCMHAHVTCGRKDSAGKVRAILEKMNRMYRDGNTSAKPETITYNIVINALAKSGKIGAANEAENLLSKMHMLHEMGDQDIKPNVVTYCAVIDAYAKSMESGAAARGDTLLANMIQLYQSDPVGNADLRPNTHVFNTVINCWSKSKDQDAASKAEEIFVAMEKLHENGIPGLKPDAFTYTVIIDAWAKTGMKGAASRAEALLSQMESKYLAGDMDLKPNTFTYNAVINSLAKSGETGAAAKAERVLQNMVNRYRAGGANDVKPTTIHFNAVLDAFAKSGGGRDAAERAENILEWMDDLFKSGNSDVKPDTITFNAVLDCWARSGDHRRAAERAEQILHHMDHLHALGNQGIKPDSYTYNVVINAWAKSGAEGAAHNAENILATMEKKYRDGDSSLKPNTRTYTSLIDCWAKSGEPVAARKAEQILITMQAKYEQSGDSAAKPNTHTANAVMNACAFTTKPESKSDALSIAFRVFEWLVVQRNINPDAYSYTIMLSVCSNLLPRQDRETRYSHARDLFLKCRESGHVNDFVLRKLRHTVTQEEYLSLVDYRVNSNANNLPSSWTRNARGNKSNRKWSRR